MRTLLLTALLGLVLALPAQACLVTRSAYENLRPGMTYRDVVQEIGCTGEEQMTAGVGASTSVNYVWRGGLFSVVVVTMVNGRLFAKMQSGLEQSGEPSGNKRRSINDPYADLCADGGCSRQEIIPDAENPRLYPELNRRVK